MYVLRRCEADVPLTARIVKVNLSCPCARHGDVWVN